MKIVLIIIGLMVLAIIVFSLYRFITVELQNKKLNTLRFFRVKELDDILKSGQSLSEKDVLPFAENILTRQTTYQLLVEYDRTDLFPKEYYTLLKAAESNLANWLEFPTELDACPDEIEYIKRVTFDFDGQNNFLHYEVFKYRINEPHWAAKDGWTLGVVGPYFDDSQPYDFPKATFSRGNCPYKNITPEEEAKWVHENLVLKS